jgi:hypothetical protein
VWGKPFELRILRAHLYRNIAKVGMLICKSKKKTVMEYSLKNMNKPIGVSEYQVTKALPDELKSSLPTIEEIEAELGGGARR